MSTLVAVVWLSFGLVTLLSQSEFHSHWSPWCLAKVNFDHLSLYILIKVTFKVTIIFPSYVFFFLIIKSRWFTSSFCELVNKAGYPLPAPEVAAVWANGRLKDSLTSQAEFHRLIISKSSSQKQDSQYFVLWTK